MLTPTFARADLAEHGEPEVQQLMKKKNITRDEAVTRSIESLRTMHFHLCSNGVGASGMARIIRNNITKSSNETTPTTGSS